MFILVDFGLWYCIYPMDHTANFEQKINTNTVSSSDDLNFSIADLRRSIIYSKPTLKGNVISGSSSTTRSILLLLFVAYLLFCNCITQVYRWLVRLQNGHIVWIVIKLHSYYIWQRRRERRNQIQKGKYQNLPRKTRRSILSAEVS